jgi:hypothetical protein
LIFLNEVLFAAGPRGGRAEVDFGTVPERDYYRRGDFGELKVLFGRTLKKDEDWRNLWG